MRISDWSSDVCSSDLGDAVPVSFDHPHELLIWLQPLPAQALLPALEESAGAALGAVAPQLAERLFQQVRRVQALVGRQQLLERLPAVQGEVFAVAQQRIALALDVASVLALQALELVTAHVTESILQVAHDLALVDLNAGLRPVRLDRVAYRPTPGPHPQSTP